MILNQSSFNKGGSWVLEHPPSDIKKLEVNEGIVGVFVGAADSVFKDPESSEYQKLYVIETDDKNPEDGNPIVKRIPGTRDLDKWFSVREPGDRVKVVRLKDIPMPPPKKPYQKYHVYVWKEGT